MRNATRPAATKSCCRRRPRVPATSGRRTSSTWHSRRRHSHSWMTARSLTCGRAGHVAKAPRTSRRGRAEHPAPFEPVSAGSAGRRERQQVVRRHRGSLNGAPWHFCAVQTRDIPSPVTAVAPSGEHGAPGWMSLVGGSAVVYGRGAGSAGTVVGVGAGRGGALVRGTEEVVVLTPALAAGVTALGEVAGVSACVVVVTRAVAVVSEASSRSPSVAAAPSTPTMRIKATVGPTRRAQRGQLRYVCHRFAPGLGLAKCAPSMGGPTASASVVSSGFGGCQRPLRVCHQSGGGAPRCHRQLASIHQLACPSLMGALPSRSPALAHTRGCRERTLPNPTDNIRQSVSGGRQGAAWWAELAI
jgi:hypothetical protein